jgi:hypothetical protein
MLNECRKYGKLIIHDSIGRTNDKTFSIGAFVLKASWVSVNAIPADSIKNYYVTKAQFGLGTNVDTSSVALLGLHVVGRVINHPEFIWATFEHYNMAPNYNWDSTTIKKDHVISGETETLLFTKGTTNGTASINWDVEKEQPYKAQQVYNLYTLGQPETAEKNDFSTEVSERKNYISIAHLNKCVKDSLGKDKWANYFYKGSVWVDTDDLTNRVQIDTIKKISADGSIGILKKGTILRGSIALSNISMETYTQAFQGYNNGNFYIHDITSANVANCFGCHTAINDSTNKSSLLYVSHLFNNYLYRLEKHTEKAVSRKKAIEFKNKLN